MNNFDEILKKLPRSISEDLKLLPASVISEVEEVRLRCGRNIRLKSHFFGNDSNRIFVENNTTRRLVPKRNLA